MDLSMAALENLKSEISFLTTAKIECIAEEGELISNLRGLVKKSGSELIIMGITGSSRLDQLLIGSNTLSLISQDIAPVLIIPPNAKFKGIKNVVYSSDFRSVERTTPLAPIKSFLDMTGAALHVVNVDSEHRIELTEEYKSEKAKLNSMLSDYKPEYYFIRLFDFTDAISTFSEGHNIDAIITVPRKHSFLESLFKSSHTKKLAYHSHVPILAIHG
jgi:nucleotide-binding universal stress UspA family protein